MTNSVRPPSSDPDRWPKVRELVESALALSGEARAQFIDRSCGTDSELRAEVWAQVAACERAAKSASFLNKPAAAFAAALLDGTGDPRPPDVVAPNESSEDDVATRLRSSLSGRYEIERELGRGGMATVYLAADPRHDRHVAVKVLNPALGVALSGERFLREIRVTAGLTHPHILPLHDSGEADGLLYYVMPYVDGETLRERLVRDPMSLGATVRLLRDVASALAYAHRHGVVHRDIKPANILLADDHAVVADFGIARAVRRAHVRDNARDAVATLTDVGTSIGTPAYMAPEQAVGDVGVDHRADLYAFGVVAYEALAGKHPFGARSGPAIIAAHLSEAPQAIDALRSDLPTALAAVVMKCLEKDPAARPQSADDIVAALDAAGPAVDPSPHRATRPRLTRPTPRPLMIVAGIVASVLVVVAFSAFLRTGRSAGAPSRGEATPAAAAMRTVAVLPFENTDGVAANEYFSDGLTDELAHALASLPGLHLSGRTSTYAFKHKAVPAQEIGRALQVGAIITGTVRHANDRLRVTTQLVSTADGKVVLDSVFESRSGDVFRVQDDLARAITAALSSTLAGHPGAAFATASRRGTADTAAYYLYLKGRYYWLERGAANVSQAIVYFRQAIARDSTFARAYAGLAMAYNVLSPYVVDPSDSVTALTAASAMRAMQLDSTSADSRLALALALDRQMRFDEAAQSYQKTLITEPTNQYAHHAFGLMLVFRGRTDDGILELQRAVQLDPLAKSAGTALVLGLINARRFPEAIAEAQRVLAFDSTFSLGLHELGIAQLFAGQTGGAVRTLEQHRRLYPERGGTSSVLVLAYAAAGRWADAERVRQQLHSPGGDRSGGAEASFADLVFGDREPIVRLLRTQPGRRAWLNSLNGFGCNPLIDPLWPDERFRSTMRDVGIEPCALARPWPMEPRPPRDSSTSREPRQSR